MPSGRIDAATSNGFIEGWAIDERNPFEPLRVAVADANGAVIAKGLANLFRDDLVHAGVGCGWSAFRLRALDKISLTRSELLLLDVDGKAVLDLTSAIREVRGPEPASDIAAIIRQDPTIISSVTELRGCGPMFSSYVEAHGVDAFVRAAFVYVLRRPPDTPGMKNYVGLLKTMAMTPLGLIYALYESKEFSGAPGTLAAPSSPAFPFRNAAK